MNNHNNNCMHCGARVGEPKPVRDGPRKGQTRTICTKCGHINFLPAGSGTIIEVGAGPGIGNFLMPRSVSA